jgi:hypothetical protein
MRNEAKKPGKGPRPVGGRGRHSGKGNYLTAAKQSVERVIQKNAIAVKTGKGTKTSGGVSGKAKISKQSGRKKMVYA